MSMERLIDARGIIKRYDGFTLDAVDLTVDAGQISGLYRQERRGESRRPSKRCWG